MIKKKVIIGNGGDLASGNIIRITTQEQQCCIVTNTEK